MKWSLTGINFVLAYENCGFKGLKWGEWVFEPDHFSCTVAQPRMNKFNNPVKVEDPKKNSCHTLRPPQRALYLTRYRLLWSTTHFFLSRLTSSRRDCWHPECVRFTFFFGYRTYRSLCTNPSFPLAFRAI